MTIRVGDWVGFYRQVTTTKENQLEYLEGLVIKFIDPSTVQVSTDIRIITIPYVALSKLGR